jgi:transcriptional regulator with XRE-family HTH domain
MELVKTIRTWRKEHHFSQNDFAKTLNMSRSGYAAIELGRNNLKAEDLIKLLNVYHIPFAIFLDEKGFIVTSDDMEQISKVNKLLNDIVKKIN